MLGTPAAARLQLFTSTALSATFPTSLKLLYATDGAPLTPPLITALRFSLMAAGSQPFLLGGALDDTNSRSGGAFWAAAIELGFWAFLGAQLSTIGLQSISAVRGTILLASINVLTPALSAAIGTTAEQRQITLRTWTACILSLLSTIVALQGGAVEASGQQTPLTLSLGDETMLGAACCYAVGQVRLSSLVANFPAPKLAAARLQTQAACSLAFFPLTAAQGVESLSPNLFDAGEWIGHVSGMQAGLLLFSAFTAISGTLLQFQGQRVVPASDAQPIYASSPLLSALWAWLALGEAVSANQVLGGLGICSAVVLAAAGDTKNTLEKHS